MNSKFKSAIPPYNRQRKCLLALIPEVLSHDSGLRNRFVCAAQANWYSESTLDTFLQRFDYDCDPVNTLAGQQSQLPPTPRTWHRVKTHHVNNNLTELPRRCRRRLDGSAESPLLASSTSGINTRQLVARQSHICLPVNVLIPYEHPIC